MTFDFKHPNNTHTMKRNVKKSSLMAMSLEFNGHLFKQYIFNGH